MSPTPVPPISVTVVGPAGPVGAEAFDIRVQVDGHGEPDFRVQVTCRCRAATLTWGRIRVTAPVAGVTDPFWLIPGLFYGENRPERCERVFPRYRAGADDPDRLVSRAWMFRADRAATPAVFAFSDTAGIALVADELSSLGMTGVGFSGAGPGENAQVALEFPVREFPASYVGLPSGRPSLGADHPWRPGEEHLVVCRLVPLSADRHDYAPVLRRCHARLAPGSAVAPWVGLATAAELAGHGLLRWHYRPEHRALVETASFDRDFDDVGEGLGDRLDMHVAWLSGVPAAAALLRHGRRTADPAAVAAAVDVLDNICTHPSPSGFFWGRWSAESGWAQSWTPVPGGLHARTLAEATLFLLRAYVAERGRGVDRPEWAAVVARNLRLAVAAQDGNGNLGSLYAADDGRVLSRDGAAGLAWVAPLAAGAELFSQPRWLDAARAAGDFYGDAVRSEFLNGAPEDVDLAPSSEDGYVALMSYWALFRATGDAGWLDLARRSADWLLTFRYSYDSAFSRQTFLGAYGFRTRGADQASPSNQHLHSYGLICSRELVELSRALADPHYAERARETLACFRQFVAREDGDFNGRRGMVAERYFHTECFRPKGTMQELSHAWCVGLLLWAAQDGLELPELQDEPSEERG